MRPAKLCSVLLLAFVLLASASVALAARRVALVVGNSTYAHIGRLPNPETDAADMASALRRLGFEVTTEFDADRVELTAPLRAFTRRSAAADVSLVFYAGHGIEMDGVNYLVPVDARLERDVDVRYETVTLEDLLASTLGASLRLVILDACRNNPLARSMQRTIARRSVSGGSFGDLSEELLGDETLVAYAAAAGTTAADGRGRNSPYTAALLAHLEQPLEIELLFRRVRAQVLSSTNGQQRPHEYQSLVGEHYLRAAPAVTSVAVASSEPAAAGVLETPAGTTAAATAETVFWESIRESRDPAEFELFLETFSNGTFAQLARNRLGALRAASGVSTAAPTVVDPPSDVTFLDVAEFRVWAERGEARAQNELGKRYENGRGVGQDNGVAVSWFRRAAEQGYARGQGNLGAMYYNGAGVPRDDEAALTWFRRAAAQGDSRGQNGLGVLYSTGRGLPQDRAEAGRWYRRAAEQGYAVAQDNLGVMYRDGRGVERDYGEAVRWFRRSAEQGNAAGHNNLGAMYGTGRGVERDDAEAVRWYRRAADQGHALAQSNLGVMYRDGRGVERDYGEAVRWFRRSAEQGNVRGQNNLGSMYATGRSVSRDDAEAVRWYRRAAGQGHATAQYNLGVMFENGRGLPRDRVEAVRWYRLAAEQGYANAQKALDRLR